jgi:hypothetical protein
MGNQDSNFKEHQKQAMEKSLETQEWPKIPNNFGRINSHEKINEMPEEI